MFWIITVDNAYDLDKSRQSTTDSGMVPVVIGDVDAGTVFGQASP